MRKIVSASTAAILATATMNIPAIVSYAATSSTDAFFVDCGVTLVDSIDKNKNVLVPVTIDKDVTISSASFTFDIYTRNSFDKAVITGIENQVSKDFTVTYKDNVVTLTAAKDVTIKKGSKLFDLKMDLTYIKSIKNGKVVELDEISSNRFIYVKLKDVSAKNAAGDTFTVSEACLNNSVGEIITTSKIKEDTTLKIDSVESASRKVEVPVYITGKVGIGILGFKVSNNAKITAVTPSSELRDAYGNNSSLVINEIASLESQSKEFKNDKLCTLTVEIPSTANTGDSFEIKLNHVDLSADDGSYSIKPALAGVIKYTGSAASYEDKYLKGDVNLDGEVDAEDATLILKWYNREGLEGEAKEKAPNDVRNSIARNNPDGDLDALELIGLANSDIDGDDTDPSDATLILKFCNQRDIIIATKGDVTEAQEKEIWDSLIKR